MNYADLAEEHKVVTKQLQDTDKQLVANLEMIRSLNRDKERKQKELDELETVAHVVAELVDPIVDGRTLLEHLRDAPRSIAGYLGQPRSCWRMYHQFISPNHGREATCRWCYW
jgi:hypothetical protein